MHFVIKKRDELMTARNLVNLLNSRGAGQQAQELNALVEAVEREFQALMGAERTFDDHIVVLGDLLTQLLRARNQQ